MQNIKFILLFGLMICISSFTVINCSHEFSVAWAEEDARFRSETSIYIIPPGYQNLSGTVQSLVNTHHSNQADIIDDYYNCCGC